MQALNQQRLFERILVKGDIENKSKNDQKLLNSIKRHISQILNTRRGTVIIDSEYGIPDMSNLPGDFSSPKTDQIALDISKTIEKFETRVSHVEVNFKGRVDNQLALKFSLSVDINYENGPKRSQWDAVVGHTST